MAKDLLLEIGTEEIPAKFLKNALIDLAQIAKKGLEELNIPFGEIQTVGTPRRMTLIVREMAEKQDDQRSENKGPSVKIAFDAAGQPTKAVMGFARGQGVDVTDLIQRDGYVYAQVFKSGQAVFDLLPELLPQWIQSMNFPKNMRWADLDQRFVRPVRWLVALWGQEVVPFTFAQVETGRVTRGHRFLSKGDISIQDANDYFVKLSSEYVMVDPEMRRQVIREQIEKLAIEHGGTATIDEDLLEEVTFLVEYPTALCGSFDPKYLQLPKEAVITPMREHQRYFPVFSKEGKLLPVFITVRNGGSDYIDIVRKGNERVLKARLADAEFFFQEDQKVTLAERLNKLKTIVFQDGLGTLYDKTLRLEQLVQDFANILKAPESVIKDAIKTAHLAKADLVTGMVCEFTELQGIMGKEYALLQGESEAVAQGIYEHYLPRFAGDDLPQSWPGRLTALADKLDNIVATFSRGLIPTGSQDPFALRRQALGIVHILIDAKYDIDLADLVDLTMETLSIETAKKAKLKEAVLDFFNLRLKNILSEEQIRYDLIDAVLSAEPSKVYQTYLKAQALAKFSQNNSWPILVQAFVRAANLAKQATNEDVLAPYFKHEAEEQLWQQYQKVAQQIKNAVAEQDYKRALEAAVTLQKPIDFFFESVMVMDKDEEVKQNRLALLKKLTCLMQSLADLTKVVL